MSKSKDLESAGAKGYVDLSLDGNTFPGLSPEFQKAEMASLIERLYLKQKQKPVRLNRERAALKEAQDHLVKTLVSKEVVLDKTFADAVEKMKERKPGKANLFTGILIRRRKNYTEIYYELPHKEEWLKTVISSLDAKFSINLEEIMKKELPVEDSEESKKLTMISAIFYGGVVYFLDDKNYTVCGVNISQTIRQETDLVPFLCKLFKETNVVQEVLQKMHPNGVVETFNTKYVPLIYDKVQPFAYSLSTMLDFRDRAVYESLYMFYTGQRDSIHEDMIDVIDEYMTNRQDSIYNFETSRVKMLTTIKIHYDEIRKAFEANYGEQSIRKAITTNLNMGYEHMGDFQANKKDERIGRLLVNVFQDLFHINKIEKRKETFCRLLKEFADSYFIRDIIWIMHRHSTQLPEDVKTYEYGRKLNSPVLFKLTVDPDQPFRSCTQVDEEDTGISMVLKTVNAMVCPLQFSISLDDMETICTSFMNDNLSYQDYLLVGASVNVVRVRVTTRI